MQITKKSSVSAWRPIFLYSIAVLLLLVFTPYSGVHAQIWEDFTVWYDGNGADSGHIYEVNYKSGSNDVTLKENAAEAGSADVPYTKRGCSFLGWSLEPENGSVITPILPGGSIWDPVDVPITWTENRKGFIFYARWDCDPSLVPPSPTPTVLATVPAPTVRSDTSNSSVPMSTPTPQLLIAPLMPNGRASSASSSQEQSPVSATATPSLLIYPSSRSRSVKKDGDLIDNSEQFEGLLIGSLNSTDNSTAPKGVHVPVLFSSADGELTSLPATGITSAAGFNRSQMPASVSYSPVNLELQIPSLNIISEIVFVENDESGYPIQWLGMDTGLLSGSSFPGEGFTVLAAHNTLDAETNGPFALIGVLREGDRFFIRNTRNELMIFEVYSNEKVNEYDYEALYQAGSVYENTVTLLTCEDERPEGGYTNRRIVSARKIN